jgi:hypothetical protein
MKYTIGTLGQSLADYLAPSFPGVTFFEDPNQQGTTTPAMFLQARYTRTEPAIGGRIFRTIGMDLVYLEDYNLPDLQSRYQLAEEKLSTMMLTFPYSNGGETTLLRTYNLEGTVDLDAMHCKFELRLYLTPEEDEVLMQSMSLTIKVVLK